MQFLPWWWLQISYKVQSFYRTLLLIKYVYFHSQMILWLSKVQSLPWKSPISYKWVQEWIQTLRAIVRACMCVVPKIPMFLWNMRDQVPKWMSDVALHTRPMGLSSSQKTKQQFQLPQYAGTVCNPKTKKGGSQMIF